MDYDEFLNLPTKITIRLGNHTEELVYKNTASYLFGNYLGFLFELDSYSNVFQKDEGIHNIIGFMKSFDLIEKSLNYFITDLEHYHNLRCRLDKNIYDRKIDIRKCTREILINALFGEGAYDIYQNLIMCGENHYENKFWNILVEAMKNKDNKVLDDVDFT